jgi:DNA-binding NarL/FixJ family response regulator
MPILIISANPLFSEAIAEILPTQLRAELHAACPEEALRCIQVVHPQILLVDEAVPPGMLKKILKAAQALPKTRLILLNSSSNDLIVLDTYPAALGSAGDLEKFIRFER